MRFVRCREIRKDSDWPFPHDHDHAYRPPQTIPRIHQEALEATAYRIPRGLKGIQMYEPELHDANATLHDNWTVTVSVSFDKLYTSDNSTLCRVYAPDNVKVQSNVTTLDAYYAEDNKTWYFRGKCDVDIQLPTVVGQHTFSVEVLPGPGPVNAGTVHIERPGNLTTLNNTCPAYVAEGSDVRCQCGYLPAQQGSPPANVSWEHNTTSAVLELDNVKRQQNGTVYRCYSVWGAGEEINAYYNYTFDVMYGPTSATIEVPEVSDPVQNTTLNCTSDDVFPAANFSWSVTCLTETLTRQSSACAVTPEVTTNGTEVVCIVLNSGVPELNATAVFKFREINDKHGQENQETQGIHKKQGLPLAVIAGGIAAIVVIVVVIIVVFVFCVRRRRRQPKKNATKERKDTTAEPAEEFQEYINEFYESSDGIEALRNNRNGTPAAAPTKDSRTQNGEEFEEYINEFYESSDGIDALRKNKNTTADPKDARPQNGQGATRPDDHQGDVYADVVKTTKTTTDKPTEKTTKKTTQDNEGQQQDTHTEAQKKPKGGEATCQPDQLRDNSDDVYMNVSP
ncbi:uncharacterized protein [Littorina saxatilis]|uniref:uncharacterized protein n=1 Tax=Littorina saxatilis TaxID=31220 RepID=UPI0038B58F69